MGAARGARRPHRGRRSRCRTSPAATPFASLARTAEDLARARRRAASRSCRRATARSRTPALAHLERALFDDAAAGAAADSTAPSASSKAPARAARSSSSRDELLDADPRRHAGRSEIALVCPSVERWRAPLETALGALGVPYAIEGRSGSARRRSARRCSRCCASRGSPAGAATCSRFLRSPYSGLARAHVDYRRGAAARPRRQRRRRGSRRRRSKLRGQPLPHARRVRGPRPTRSTAVRELVRSMLRAAYGLEAPPAGETPRLDLRAHEAVDELLDELERLARPRRRRSRARSVVAALERAHGAARAARDEPGRVAVLDLLRARTRRFEVVFVLGLEEGSLPRRARSARRSSTRSAAVDELAPRAARRGPTRSRATATSSTPRARAPSRRLYLVREAATDDGSPREPSPFWDEVARALRRRRRRALDDAPAAVARSPGRSRPRRPSASGCARSPRSPPRDDADAHARSRDANGWERRLERALRRVRRGRRG